MSEVYEDRGGVVPEDKKKEEKCEMCNKPNPEMMSVIMENADGDPVQIGPYPKPKAGSCKCSPAEKAIYKLLKEIREMIRPPYWGRIPADTTTTHGPYVFACSLLDKDHDWEEVKDTAAKPYWKCRKCGQRKEY